MVKSNIDKKFSAHYDAVEAELKSSTVGESSAAPRRVHCSTSVHLKIPRSLTRCAVACPPGLVTLNDMKAKQEALVKEREKQLAKKEQSKELQL